MVRMGEGSPAVLQAALEQLEEKLKDPQPSDGEFAFDWKKSARRRKVEREVHEKYGSLKDIILDPNVQFVKQYMEDNVPVDIVLGEPMMPVSTAFIVLFMMHKRVNNALLLLVAAFIFNLNPLYVSIGVLAAFFMSHNRKPKQFVVLKRAVTTDLRTKKTIRAVHHEQVFDHVLVGSSLSTLYAAALLAKCGHKCCVLQPDQAPKLETHPEGAPCSAPLISTEAHKAERYQRLLDVAQKWDEHRACLVPLGSAADGYTHTVVRIRPSSTSAPRTFHVRTGDQILAQELSSQCLLDKAVLMKAFAALKGTMNYISGLLAARMVEASEWAGSAQSRMSNNIAFFDLATGSVEQAARGFGIEDSVALEHIAGLAAAVSGESLPGHLLSGAHLGILVNSADTGQFVLAGGAARLEKALMATIQETGGAVLSDVEVRGLLLDKVGDKYVAAGATLRGEHGEDVTLLGTRSVVSGMGLLCTNVSLLPVDAVSAPTRAALSDLHEAAPVVRCVFWLHGSAVSLDLHSASVVELTSPDTERKWRRTRVFSPSAMDPRWADDHPVDVSVVVVEADLTGSSVTTKSYQWPVSPDVLVTDSGPRFFSCPHSPETDPNHADFALRLGRPLPLSDGKKAELLRTAENLLLETYPKALGHIVFRHCEEPVLGGHRVRSCGSKYSTALRARSDVQKLFLATADLTTTGLMGEIQAGWVAASAVLGYSLEEAEQGRNVVADLQRMQS